MCRETGHGADECPKDPNLRMGYNQEEEGIRIAKLDQTKKRGDNF